MKTTSFFVPSQRGFTLVELIIVIVILAIMAATALPKLMNFAGDARRAKVETKAAEFRTWAKFIYGKSLIQGPINTERFNRVEVGGVAILTRLGYPTARMLDDTANAVDLATFLGIPQLPQVNKEWSLKSAPTSYYNLNGCNMNVVFKNYAPTQPGTISWGAATVFSRRFMLNDAPDPENCAVVYADTCAVGEEPTIEALTTGC